jgi:hypothetical protein
MKISLDIRPTKISAPTKNALMSKIQGRGTLTYTISGAKGTSYNGYVDKNAGVIYLFNLVKFRHKSKDTNKGRVRVRDAHWDAYVYRVPLSLVKSAKQGPRNFKLVVKVPS